MIRPIVLSDVQQVVDVHIEAFPDSFLTLLGRDVLSMIYSEIARNGFAYVDIENEEVAGFLGGIFVPAKQFYKSVAKRNLLSLSVHIPGSILRNPILLRPVVARVRGLLGKEHTLRAEEKLSQYTSLINSDLTVFHALTMAVSPRHRRKGIANKLWLQLLKDLPTRNVDAIVGSVLVDNEPTNNLYKKMNFKIIDRVPRSDGNDELKWLFFQRGEATVMDDGSVIWKENLQVAGSQTA